MNIANRIDEVLRHKVRFTTMAPLWQTMDEFVAFSPSIRLGARPEITIFELTREG